MRQSIRLALRLSKLQSDFFRLHTEHIANQRTGNTDYFETADYAKQMIRNTRQQQKISAKLAKLQVTK